MSVDVSVFTCRLCRKTDVDGSYLNVFESSGTNGTRLFEVIKDLLQLEVNEEDGLPSKACCDCCKKLGELSEFKRICVRSARELERKRPTGGPGCVQVKEEKVDPDDCPSYDEVTVKQERNADEEEVITDDFTSINRGIVPEEDAVIQTPNRTERDWLVADGDCPAPRPVEVFVSVGDDCGLPLSEDGSPAEERDPLCMSEDPPPSTPFPFNTSEKQSYIEERFSESSRTVGNLIIVTGLKQNVGSNESETSTLPVTDASVQQGSANVFGESSRAAVGVAHRGMRREPRIVDDLNCSTSTRKPRPSAKQDTDESGHLLLFKCADCRKMFVSRYLLKVHKCAQRVGDALECATCGRRFSTKGNLNLHIRMHSGERPFACQTCDMRFARKGILQRHLRTHTGERPYNCTMCDKSFATQDTLNKHLRTHTGERPYLCGICGLRYKARNQLGAHMKIHSGLKPFCCVACGKRFGRKESLNCHLQTHLDRVSLPM